MPRFSIAFMENKRFLNDVICISPDYRQKGFNDFGYQFSAIATILIQGHRFEYEIYALPMTDGQAAKNISRYVQEEDNFGVGEHGFADRDGSDLVTLLSDPQEYCRAYEELGHRTFNQFMRSICEVGYLKRFGYAARILNNLDQDERFRLSVLRNDLAYQSYRMGYFCAANLPSVEDTKLPFSLAISVPGYANPHFIAIDYVESEIVDDRIHTFVGINGSGKTQCLAGLVSGLCTKINRRVAVSRRSKLYTYDDWPKTEARRRYLGNENIAWRALPLYSNVLVYSSDTDNVFPKTVSALGAFNYQYADLNALRNKIAPEATLLIDLLRDPTRLRGNQTRLNLLRAGLEDIIPLDKLVIPILSPLDGQEIIRMPDGELWAYLDSPRGEMKTLEFYAAIDRDRKLSFYDDGEIVPLSSGQNSIFRCCVHLASSVRSGSLIILDEPETHLHPNWITAFIRFLYRILKGTNSVAIIATHSAYVVRELPSHCNHLFRVFDDRSVEVTEVYEPTLGASISSISEIVFGDSLADAYYEEITENLASSGKSLDYIIEHYGSLLSVDMLSKVRRRMRDR